MSVTNILIVGVGGQGTVLASRVLSKALLAGGYDVKVSEIHGMAQRGGSVVTQVRYGEEVASPIISPGSADLILSFEQLEALRYLPYLKKGGKILTNTQKIKPMPVVTGQASYPEDVLERLKAVSDILPVDALSIALNCGSVKAVNVVLLGILSAFMELAEESWLAALRESVPERFRELNEKAFAAGRTAAQQS